MNTEFRQTINAPSPSPYNSNDLIDEVATLCNQHFRAVTNAQKNREICLEELLDLLGIELCFEFIDEPEDSFFFANYSEENAEGLVTVNEKHRDFFREHPLVFRRTVCHEVGHSLLEHLHYQEKSTENLSLFEEPVRKERVFHKATWPHYGMDKTTYLKLKELEERALKTIAKKAAVNSDARDALHKLTTKFEPEWMFWQAEHFSLCVQMPRDLIDEELERPIDLASWGTICQLASKYGVTPSMMKTRLRKMGVIEYGADGRLHIAQSSLQRPMF
jgi:hypothetical protein